jgi:uncharacterized protein (TIGR03435 family)
MKRALYRAIPLAFATCALWAQSAPAEFEVATVKPTAPPEMAGGKVMFRMGCTADPGRVNCSGLTVKDMLSRAYTTLKPYQISGPSWIESERWDVTAKIPDGVPQEKVPDMWQNLLTSRFHVVTRKETKDLNIYALLVGKNGPKLTPAEQNDAPITITAPDGSKVSVPRGQAITAAGGAGAKSGVMTMDGSGKMQVKNSTLGGFSDMLSRMMDRPVLDMTNVEGRYDIVLEVSMEDMIGMKRMSGGGAMIMHGGGDGGGAGGPAPDSNPRGSIYSAVQQLGLKLEPRKAALEALVVEKADRPSEN